MLNLRAYVMSICVHLWATFNGQLMGKVSKLIILPWQQCQEKQLSRIIKIENYRSWVPFTKQTHKYGKIIERSLT